MLSSPCNSDAQTDNAALAAQPLARPLAPELSVVILCYKAGTGVIDFIERMKLALDKATISWELVLVGNYNKGDSGDPTPDVVRSLAAKDPRIVAVTLEKQGWMGWDARTGLARATGKAIAIIDGDNQMPPEDVERVYLALKDAEVDMVTTFRQRREDGFFRLYQSLIYNFVFRLLFPGIGVRDVNSKPKIMRRELYDKLHLTSEDWFLDAEIIIQVRRHKARLIQIPTVFRHSEARCSLVRLSAIWEFLVNLVRTRFWEFFIRP